MVQFPPLPALVYHARLRNMVRIERFDTTCGCGYPISVRIFDGTRVVVFKRPGQSGSGLSIAACPKCRERWPRLSADEFKQRIFRVP